MDKPPAVLPRVEYTYTRDLHTQDLIQPSEDSPSALDLQQPNHFLFYSILFTHPLTHQPFSEHYAFGFTAPTRTRLPVLPRHPPPYI